MAYGIANITRYVEGDTAVGKRKRKVSKIEPPARALKG